MPAGSSKNASPPYCSSSVSGIAGAGTNAGGKAEPETLLSSLLLPWLLIAVVPSDGLGVLSLSLDARALFAWVWFTVGFFALGVRVL